MNPSRMIPAIWIRMIVMAAFGIFVTWQGYWFVGILAGVLVLVSMWQLWMAYKHRNNG